MKTSPQPYPPRAEMPDASPTSARMAAAFSGGACLPAEPLWPHFLTGQRHAPVRVVLLDPDEFMRRVIAQELLSDMRIHLQAQGASVREGRRLLASEEVDVLMLDLHLSDGSGETLVREARQRHPGCEVIVLSAVEDDTHVLQALDLGATGYLLKNAWLQSFAQAVLHVVNEGAAITPRLSRRLLARMGRPPVPGAAPETAPCPPTLALTQREREVLHCVGRGCPTKEIGERLGISSQTVNAHVRNIYRKLNVRSRAQAVSLAAKSGQI